MASFPGSVFNPATRSAGQTIDASHINDLQDEVVAVEDGFRNATAPLNSSNSTMVALSVTGGSTLATLSVSGGSTFAGAVTFSGAVTLSTGITLSTGVLTLNQGQIEFPATQVASASTRVLDDYREGVSWTPTDASGAGLSITNNGCKYVKIGRVVFIFGYLTYPTNANGSNALTGGLPFTSDSGTYGAFALAWTDKTALFTIMPTAGATTFDFRTTSAANLTNANMSAVAMRFAGIYLAAS